MEQVKQLTLMHIFMSMHVCVERGTCKLYIFLRFLGFSLCESLVLKKGKEGIALEWKGSGRWSEMMDSEEVPTMEKV